jgi:hypothetical protein
MAHLAVNNNNEDKIYWINVLTAEAEKLWRVFNKEKAKSPLFV